uniref:Uncharacterized protein n=1 Tax=Mola mola TaxID=94237 RepID=A0A3Q3W0X3_MOLML
MSAYSSEVLLATSVLCGSGGAMKPLQLYHQLLQRCRVSEEEFRFILQECPRFLLVRDPAGGSAGGLEDCVVVARTSLRLCGAYGRDACRGAACCQQLHLCKFFIYRNCRFGRGRKTCKFSHDIHSDHNYQLLRELTLHELSQDHLFVLLLQNDPTLLPEVCLHYNKGSCTFQELCTKVHLCQHFVRGDCAFGLRCNRQHTIDQHGRLMLEERGLSADVIQELPFIYKNIHHLTSLPQREDSNHICLHFIRNSCRFHNECRRVHFHLPYKWEVFDGSSWTDLQDMEDIERDFCDPSRTQSCGDRPVDFVTMSRESQPVRRLSTVSSVTKPPHYSLTTQWLWYYKGDQGNWVEYGQLDKKQRSTSVSSQTLEEAFLSNKTAEVNVVKGQREYILSFNDMYQRNPKHNTKRRVCRRPRFVSVAEVEKQAFQ